MTNLTEQFVARILVAMVLAGYISGCSDSHSPASNHAATFEDHPVARLPLSETHRAAVAMTTESHECRFERLLSEAREHFQNAPMTDMSPLLLDLASYAERYHQQTTDLRNARVEIGGHVSDRQTARERELSLSLAKYKEALAIADQHFSEDDERVLTVLSELAERFPGFSAPTSADSSARLDVLRSARHLVDCETNYGRGNSATHAAARDAIRANFAYCYRHLPNFESELERSPGITNAGLLRRAMPAIIAVGRATHLLKMYQVFAVKADGSTASKRWAFEYWRSCAVLGSLINRLESGGERVTQIQILAATLRNIKAAQLSALLIASELLSEQVQVREKLHEHDLCVTQKDHCEFIGNAEHWLTRIRYGTPELMTSDADKCLESLLSFKSRYRATGLHHYMGIEYRSSKQDELLDFKSEMLR